MGRGVVVGAAVGFGGLEAEDLEDSRATESTPFAAPSKADAWWNKLQS